MKNLVLVKDECALCNGPIDREWAGPDPSLGTVCRQCSGHRDDLFGPEHVEITVKKHLIYDPVLGVYEYRFDWAGTKVMINGQVGTVTEAYLGSCTVVFPNDDKWGTSISTLDHWRLLEIYRQTGGESEPPPLDLPPHEPIKAELLDQPLLEVKVNSEGGRIRSIQVGHKSIGAGLMFQPTELPFLQSLHAFTNMYVRFKYGLAPNFCAEGGFIGHNFAVRNAGGFIGGVGLSVSGDSAADELRDATSYEDVQRTIVRHGLIGMMVEQERARPGVVQNASAKEVLATWVKVMETLLQYDWRSLELKTVGDVWTHYCRMQDILLNIMPADELAAALEYSRTHRLKHCGCSY